MPVARPGLVKVEDVVARNRRRVPIAVSNNGRTPENACSKSWRRSISLK